MTNKSSSVKERGRERGRKRGRGKEGKRGERERERDYVDEITSCAGGNVRKNCKREGEKK